MKNISKADGVKKINILILAPKRYHNRVEVVEGLWNKYFDVNIILDEPENIKDYFKMPIDILFLWYKKMHHFEFENYGIFQANNERFKYIVLKKHVDVEEDIQIYKELADDIVYLDEKELYVWKSLAILRRFWNTASKDTTIIYKGIIADFIDHKFNVERKDVELTNKEEHLLRIFMCNIGKFIPKARLFKSIWGYDDDISRSLDQMIFKLRKKIGSNYITTSRTKGFKFE